LLLISYYTENWAYPAHAHRLKQECKALKIRHRIEALQDTGSYLKNCCYKPRYILECLREEKAPVLWVDVDASILAYPEYFDTGLDYDMQAKRMKEPRKRTWHVGTIWFNYNPTVMQFLTKWAENTGACSDESSLEQTWREMPIKARDIPDDYFGITGDRPFGVICHRISDSLSKKRESKFFDRYEQEVI